jgi:hypothetical protein
MTRQEANRESAQAMQEIEVPWLCGMALLRRKRRSSSGDATGPTGSMGLPDCLLMASNERGVGLRRL